MVLKNNYENFIQRLSDILESLNNSNNKIDYLKNIINKTNKKLYNNVSLNLDLACYYYIINKISFRGTLNYDKNNEINITINKNRISMLLKFGEKHKNKLHNYSLFLNKIELVNIDIEKNYREILNNIDEKTLIYADPPYYKDINNNKPYSNMFSKQQYEQLKIFLDNVYQKGSSWIKSNSFSGYIIDLFKNYKKSIFNTRNNICNSLRTELLISSF